MNLYSALPCHDDVVVLVVFVSISVVVDDGRKDSGQAARPFPQVFTLTAAIGCTATPTAAVDSCGCQGRS